MVTLCHRFSVFHDINYIDFNVSAQTTMPPHEATVTDNNNNYSHSGEFHC